MKWIFFLLVLIPLSGCFAWQPSGLAPESFGKQGDMSLLRSQARDLYAVTDSRAQLLEVIRMQKEVLRSTPGDREVLVGLANQYILLGAGYAKDSAERETAYITAMDLSATACYGDPDFRRRIAAGEPFWQASAGLGEEYLDAMGFWVTALFYWYKDCQGAIGQVVNFRWMGYARQVMEQMTRLDGSWGDGMLSFLWGIYYLAIPEAVGGDRDRSAAFFQRAIQQGPNWLQHRWGRGRYFHVKMRDKHASRKDLEWVASQPLSSVAGPYAWRVYIQRDAQQFLADLDRYFP